MKIIKNIIKNNKIPEISPQDKLQIAVNETIASDIRREREYERRNAQSAVDILKGLQKTMLIKKAEPIQVKSIQKEESLQPAELVQPATPVLMAKQLQNKDKPFISDQNERMMREIRKERELQRRTEQSQLDKAKTPANKFGLFSAPLNMSPFAAPKPKAKLSIDDMSLILDQHQRARAIKMQRELERRAEQSQLDKAKKRMRA